MYQFEQVRETVNSMRERAQLHQATRGDLWLSVPEVAQLLRVQSDTVRRWIRNGLIPALELGGPRAGYRIRREDLDHFLWQRFRMRSQDERDLEVRDEYANLAAERTYPRVMPVADVPIDIPLGQFDKQHTIGNRPGKQDLDPQGFVQYPLMSYHRSAEHVVATIDYVSPYIEEISGHSAADFRASATLWRELIHPDDRERIFALRRRQLQSNERFAFEYRLQGVDGQTLWVREEAVPQETSSGDNPWDGIVLNIDERKRVEQALQSRLRQQDVVAQISRRALETSDLQLLFDEAVLFVHDTLGVDYSKVLRLEPGGDHFLIIAGVGWQEGFVGQATVSATAYSQAGYTLLSNAPIIVEDLRRETRFEGPSVLFEHNVISSLTVIIPGPEKAWGVLGAHTLRYRPFSVGDVYFLQSVANAIANAILLHRQEGHDTHQWLTVTEVAERLQVTEETVRRWIRSNQLPVVELGSRRAGYRIHPSDLDQFLRDRYHSTTTDSSAGI
jgi:excisionase family DNA binding protein/PAS domain S-box-containing protein